MSLGVSSQKENGLSVCLDWLAFTVTKSNFNLENVIEFLGCQIDDFDEMPKGGNGYSSMVKLQGYPVFILYNGRKDMGIHVSVSGSAITEILKKYSSTKNIEGAFGTAPLCTYENFLCELFLDIRKIGQITRLDLALDDKTDKFFTIENVLEYLDNGQAVSKFRGYKHIKESSLSGDLTGQGLYLGSRKSDVMLRFYDKKIEQEKKKTSPVVNSWYRWEFELKNERANAVADLIIQNTDIGVVFTGILNNYFRLINLDDTNKSRCSILDLWLDFIGSVEKLQLSLVSEPKTIEQKRAWFQTQCAPTLAGLIIADGGDFSIITEYFDDYVRKMSRDLIDLVAQAVPDWQENYRGVA